MKKNLLMLPCVAAVAIALFAGKKYYGSHVSETSSLLMQNVEALSSNESGNENYNICYSESKVAKGHTYYDCGSCEKIYDEKGKGTYSKCFK